MRRVLIGSIAEMRVSISRAALLVTVTARTRSGSVPGLDKPGDPRGEKRRLPRAGSGENQPDWSGRVTAASCSGLRFRGADMGRRERRHFTSGPPRRAGQGSGPDLLLVRPSGRALERLGHGLGVFLRRETGQPHAYTRLSRPFREYSAGYPALRQIL